MSNHRERSPEDSTGPEEETYCCPMRQKFLIGILAEREDLPTPVDAADFMDFDETSGDDRPILRIKFCPFCGKPVVGPLRVL
jgi:hypothetical protein